MSQKDDNMNSQLLGEDETFRKGYQSIGEEHVVDRDEIQLNKIGDQEGVGLRNRKRKSTSRRKSTNITFSKDYPIGEEGIPEHYSEGTFTDEDDEIIDPNDLERKKMVMNSMFGIIPFAEHITKREISERSEKVQQLYESISHLKPEQVTTKITTYSKNRMIGFGNVMYAILFGWWIFLWYCFVGILCYCSIICYPYGKKCFELAFYFLYPFGKYIERLHDKDDPSIQPSIQVLVTDSTESNNNNNNQQEEEEDRTLLNNNNEANNNDMIERKSTGQLIFKYTSMIIWFIFFAPLLVIFHFLIIILTWYTIFGIPSCKIHIEGFKLLYRNVLTIKVSDEFPPNVDSDIILCSYQGFNLYYYKFAIFGLNVLLLNMLPFVIVSIVLGYAFGDEFVEEYPFAVFPCCLISTIPLSYLISKSVSMISAQSNYVVGAVLNASFGSVIELILFFVTLWKGLNDVVMQAVTGSFLGDTLLMPGLSMIFGGLRHRVQYFNRHAAGTSSLLLLVAVIGCFVPTVFYQIYGNYELNCGKCINIQNFINQTANSTLELLAPTITYNANNNTNGTDPGYLLMCQKCEYIEKDFTHDPIYINKARPLAFTTAGILPFAYLVGLIFSLKTHNKFYLKPPKKDDSEDEGKMQGHGGNIAEWPKWVCVVILLLATIAFAFVAESLTKALEPTFKMIGIPTEFAGLTIFAIVPNISEFVSACKFALQNNITLALEIGNVAGIQTALIQIPILVIFSAIIFQNDTNKVFSLTFPRLDLVAIFFAVIILNYVTIDGKSNYFHGISLVIVYIILVVSFFFAYF
ncbi:hypothetical protein ABK040_008740 [Willaertia magna]